MTGILVVILSVCAAAYLILKRYYAPGSLLLVGLITLAVSIFIGPDPLITGKKATHLAGLDVIQCLTNLLQTRTAGLGMLIMSVGGFSAYMDKVGAARALVLLSTKPLQKIKSPYLVMVLGYLLCLALNVFIPSAAGLAMLMMVSLYPILVSAGISKQSAAATVLVGGCCCFGPSGGNTLMGSELTNMHVMDFFLNVQWAVGWVVIPVTLAAHFFIQKWFDKKDLASGRLTAEDFKYIGTEQPDQDNQSTPLYYALFPLIPVVLLFVFSPLVYKGIRMEVVTAIFCSAFTAFIIDLIRRRSLKECLADLKAIPAGMGKTFTTTIFLIISAEVFAQGLTKSGGIATIIQSVSGLDAGAAAIFTVMFFIVAASAFVMGSGNAAFFSFAPMIPQAAAAVGGHAAFMISPLQLVSGMARSGSPVAGVTIAVAGVSGVQPFDLIRRTIPVMIITALTLYLHALTFV